MAHYMAELEQDPFDPEEFVERLAWRTSSTSSKPSSNYGDSTFDPISLHESFVRAIRDLRILQDDTQRKCERLEMICGEEEKCYWQKIEDLQDRNEKVQKIIDLKGSAEASISTFQELDAHISSVATKVVYLGDQLESVNTPRARAVEAQKLMNYFAEFLNPGPLTSEVFVDPFKLFPAADVIHKLHLIAQELPSGKFDKARVKIAKKYDEIERALIEDFVGAQLSDDRTRMAEIASILSHFKGYSQCVDAFIEQSQKGTFLGLNVFADVVPLCKKSAALVNSVFTNPDQVMSKFVLNIYHGILQDHIQQKLADRSNPDFVLRNLYDLYSKTVKLSSELSTLKIGCDQTFLNKLTKNIFASIQGTLREMQARIVTKSNVVIPTDHGNKETFLSEEVAINLLQESKLSFQRCKTLSTQSDLPKNAEQIFDIQIQHLCVEYLDYAIELGLHNLPNSEPKTTPEIFFFDIVEQCNGICVLWEKQFNDSLVPLVVSTPKHGDCLQKKKNIMDQLEMKLDTGLDRAITPLIGWIHFILQNEQKKSDYKPESEDIIIAMATPACSKVVKFVNQQVSIIRNSLDGKNVEAALTEFGTRLHRVIFEHLQQFQYSSVGAMSVICDVNEYKKCVMDFKIPLINTLFDTLHAMCNLLVVVPENLKQVCTNDQLAGMDKNVLMNFVHLRADYKSAKILNHDLAHHMATAPRNATYSSATIQNELINIIGDLIREHILHLCERVQVYSVIADETSDEPPYLTVGTEVSARYKGAFCEAKVKKVNRQVKCRVGSTIEAKNSENGQFHDAVITKLNDCSQYTVVFDDGDVTTLRRTSLCLKSGKHFAESETLDQLPLTNPEHFGTPVVNIKAKRKRSFAYELDKCGFLTYNICISFPRISRDDSSDECPSPAKSIKKNKYHLKELEADLGRIVCVDYGDKRKKDSWFPGLIVSPTVQDNVTINQKEDYLIRSFKDDKYYTVCKKDARPFKKEIVNKVDGNQLKAVEKAIQFMENAELPTHWDKDTLLNLENDNEDEQSDSDSDSSNDEPTEDEDRFIAQLYNFMDERSTPINKAPSIGNRDLNLYKLFNVVQKLGGFNRVTNQTKWKTVNTKMGLQSSGSNGTVLIKQAYRKYLLGFEEIHKKLGYTMVGKESTRSGRSPRNIRPPLKAVVKKKVKLEEKEKKENNADSESSRKSSNASSNDDQPDVEIRRTPRGKGKEEKEKEKEKEEISPTKKVKTETIQKKETRNTPSVKSNDKAKEEKDKPSPRSRLKKEENEKTTDQKPIEPPSAKRQGRKKSVVDTAPKQNEDNESSDDHIKNGPVGIGDRVKVKYGNGDHKKFYEAKVREIVKEHKSKNFLVHYTGWNMRYDEWVDGYNIECVQEKSDGKLLNIKKKNIPAPKTPEPPKFMKRGRTVSERSSTVVKGPPSKSKPTSDPVISAPAKASTFKVISQSTKPMPTVDANGKSPSRASPAANNNSAAGDDSPPSRVSRSTRSERKISVKSSSTPPPIQETRRRSRKTSEVLSHCETSSFNEPAVDSSTDEEDRSETKTEPNIRTRRKKEAERSASLEPVKKLNTRSSTSKKNDKNDEETDIETLCVDDGLNFSKSSPETATSSVHSDVEEDINTNKNETETETENSSIHSRTDTKVMEPECVPVKKEESKGKLQSPSAKENLTESSQQSDSTGDTTSAPGLAIPEPLRSPVREPFLEVTSEGSNISSPPILEVQVPKSEVQTEFLNEEDVKNVEILDSEKKSEDDSQKSSEQNDSVECKPTTSKKIKRKRVKQNVYKEKNDPPNNSEKEEIEPKEEIVKVEKIESNKEVIKSEGTAIVEDAIRKIAASYLKDSIKTVPEVIKEIESESVDTLKQLSAEGTKLEEEMQLPPAMPNLETKDQVNMKDVPPQNIDILPQINLLDKKPDTNISDECEILSHTPDADDEDDEIKLIGGESNETGKVKKKKLKDKDSKEPKSKKAKKKEKKLKSKEDDDLCKDWEKLDSDKAKKKDKKKAKKAEDLVSLSENLSFLAEVTVNSPMKKEKKKSKKIKDKLVDESERKGKKRKDRDSDDDKKVRKLKKKKGKLKSANEIEKRSSEVTENKDLGANISLLCEEDVLPASPIPPTDIVPDIYPHSSGSSLAARAPALAAELQHPSSLTINTVIHATNNSTISSNQYTFNSAVVNQVKQYEAMNEAPQLLADNTPPTTPEGSITSTSIISSPCQEREGLEGSSSCQEVSGNNSPRSGPESCTADQESRDEDKVSHDITESTDKDGIKRKGKNIKRTRNFSESSRSSIKIKTTSAKDTDPGTDSSDAKEKSAEPAFSYTHLQPKSSKFNFHVPLDEYTDGAKRIELITDKMSELRKTYMSLKSELAQIDRRRKKARKKEREAVENQVIANPVQCS
ncbi:Exocyst complex component 5 [Nymphon striatum]|nr:Exocyst complex component 5 [Nymphon striatum]